jgi:hypothetical protein
MVIFPRLRERWSKSFFLPISEKYIKIRPRPARTRAVSGYSVSERGNAPLTENLAHPNQAQEAYSRIKTHKNFIPHSNLILP